MPPGAATVGIVGAATSSETAIPYTLGLLGPSFDDTIFRNGFD
jgi:hypothetical protein